MTSKNFSLFLGLSIIFVFFSSLKSEDKIDIWQNDLKKNNSIPVNEKSETPKIKINSSEKIKVSEKRCCHN